MSFYKNKDLIWRIVSFICERANQEKEIKSILITHKFLEDEADVNIFLTDIDFSFCISLKKTKIKVIKTKSDNSIVSLELSSEVLYKLLMKHINPSSIEKNEEYKVIINKNIKKIIPLLQYKDIIYKIVKEVFYEQLWSLISLVGEKMTKDRLIQNILADTNIQINFILKDINFSFYLIIKDRRVSFCKGVSEEASGTVETESEILHGILMRTVDPVVAMNSEQIKLFIEDEEGMEKLIPLQGMSYRIYKEAFNEKFLTNLISAW